MFSIPTLESIAWERIKIKHDMLFSCITYRIMQLILKQNMRHWNSKGGPINKKNSSSNRHLFLDRSMLRAHVCDSATLLTTNLILFSQPWNTYWDIRVAFNSEFHAVVLRKFLPNKTVQQNTLALKKGNASYLVLSNISTISCFRCNEVDSIRVRNTI